MKCIHRAADRVQQLALGNKSTNLRATYDDEFTSKWATISFSGIRSRTQSVVGGSRGAELLTLIFRRCNFKFAGKHAFISHQLINPPEKAGIYTRVQAQPVHRRLHTSGSRSTEAVFIIYLSVYLYFLDIPIEEYTVSQLPFCNCSTRQMVGFCVHMRAQLWLSFRAGAHSYKNKWSMMVPISSTRERFMPTGGGGLHASIKKILYQ